MTSLDKLKRDVEQLHSRLPHQPKDKEFLIYINSVGVPTDEGINELIKISQLKVTDMLAEYEKLTPQEKEAANKDTFEWYKHFLETKRVGV